MIEGERVCIRKLERTDLALLHRWMNDRDLMAWARFSPDSEALRGFQSDVQLLDHVRGFRSYPALWNWSQKKTNGHPVSAYVLIRTTNPQKSIVELKKMPMVQEIIGTSGDSDLVARIGPASNEDLREIVVDKIQSMPGVVSTETFLAFPKL